MDKAEIEEGLLFMPRFDDRGLVPCVTKCVRTGNILMVAYMNALALRKTIETGEAYYWSRSRNELWHKGGSSGLVQKIVEMRTDCDQDCILIDVEIMGDIQGSCHTGRAGCFYRSIPIGQDTSGDIRMEFKDSELVFDPADVYKK